MTITNVGINILMDRFLTGSTYSIVSQFKVGNDSTTPTETDTDLAHAIPITGTELVDSCDVITGWTDSADMTVSVNSSTFKEGVAALNLTKDGSGSTTASTSKTVTSLTFTSKELSIWVYIVDGTALAKLETLACLNIRYGSDSGNYYEWNKDLADLVTGWNLIDGLTSANADSTTGAPALGAMDYAYIDLVATGAGITWSAGDFVMDDWKLVSSDDYFGSFEATYPSIDETNQEITYRMVLNSLVANGYNLKEVGIFNTDTTPSIWSRDVFTSISKSNTEEVRFIIKDRFTANNIA